MGFCHLSPFSQVTSEHQERGQVYPVSPPNEVEIADLAARMHGSSQALCGAVAALPPPRPCLDQSKATAAAREEAPPLPRELRRKSDGESSV